MSLINQVLRDLEARRRREQHAPGDIHAVAAGTRNLPRSFFILAGIALLVVTLYLIWNNWRHASPPAVANSVAPTAARAKPQAKQPVAITDVAPTVPAAASVSAQAATPMPVPVTPEPTKSTPAADAKAQIALLDAAPTADGHGFRLQFDHAPAYHLFTLHQPERIVLDINDVTAAKDFARHAPLPAGVNTTRFSLQPGNRMRIVFEVNQGVTATVATMQDTALLLQFIQPAVTAASVSKPHVTSTKSVAPAAAAPGDMQKTLRNTPEDLAHDAYNDGLAQLDAGDRTAAEHRFRDALQQLPAFDPARIALARLLAQTGRNSDAESILAEGIRIGRNKPQFARLDANLLVQQGALADAIKVLESALPDIHSEPEHYAFMAALAQRSGDNARAVKLYREVLGVRSDNGLWWTGLGISLERTKQQQAALDAYRHAQQSGDLSAEVAQFVNQRIKALEP